MRRANCYYEIIAKCRESSAEERSQGIWSAKSACWSQLTCRQIEMDHVGIIQFCIYGHVWIISSLRRILEDLMCAFWKRSYQILEKIPKTWFELLVSMVIACGCFWIILQAGFVLLQTRSPGIVLHQYWKMSSWLCQLFNLNYSSKQVWVTKHRKNRQPKSLFDMNEALLKM